LRTGSTELLDDSLDGFLDEAWWHHDHGLNEDEDYVFPGFGRREFEFEPYDRMVSVPVSFLTGYFEIHGDEASAVFEPKYAGVPPATFFLSQSDEGLDDWNTAEENDGSLAWERHTPLSQRSSLLYGDPHGTGTIGLRLNTNGARSFDSETGRAIKGRSGRGSQ